ncbi:MAG: orotate phosphoribosyltransferase [Rikenellaceae bacterium]
MQKDIAQTLLQIKAIKLNLSNPFTWASGWRSPIYCDNRTILSFPDQRGKVARSFAQLIQESFPEAELVAGVATGAISWGVLAADRLNKPAIYVRSAPKAHGIGNQIEGKYERGQKVVVVEDLISTGGSSLAAVEAMRKEGLEVVGMVAIFTYGFPKAAENFEKAGVRLITLSNYNVLIDEALSSEYITEDQVDTLKEWRLAPDQWMK